MANVTDSCEIVECFRRVESHILMGKGGSQSFGKRNLDLGFEGAHELKWRASPDSVNSLILARLNLQELIVDSRH